MHNGWRYSVPLPAALDLPARTLPVDLSVLALVRSLGIRATLRGRPVVFRARELGTSWKVHFTTAQLVTRLARKAARLPSQVHAKARYLSIVSIEPGEIGLGARPETPEPHHKRSPVGEDL